jgi:UDP-2,3-diacylglucosamine hydrolase
VHWFLADSHLRPDDPECLSAMLKLLRRARSENITGLYVLGDLFHIWCYRKVEEEPAYRAVVDEINQLAAAECRVMLFIGNRDFLLLNSRDFSQHVAILGKGLTLSIDGSTFYLGHGDELCVNDRAYQRYRRFIRSRLTLALLMRLPLPLRRLIAGGMEHKSRQLNKSKPQQLLGVPEQQYLDLAAQGHNWIIHGHTHIEESRQIQVGGMQSQVIALPPWGEEHRIGVFDAAKGKFFLQQMD